MVPQTAFYPAKRKAKYPENERRAGWVADSAALKDIREELMGELADLRADIKKLKASRDGLYREVKLALRAASWDRQGRYHYGSELQTRPHNTKQHHSTQLVRTQPHPPSKAKSNPKSRKENPPELPLLPYIPSLPPLPPPSRRTAWRKVDRKAQAMEAARIKGKLAYRVWTPFVTPQYGNAPTKRPATAPATVPATKLKPKPKPNAATADPVTKVTTKADVEEGVTGAKLQRRIWKPSQAQTPRRESASLKPVSSWATWDADSRYAPTPVLVDTRVLYPPPPLPPLSPDLFGHRSLLERR